MKKEKINKKILKISTLLVLVLFFGELNLIFNPNMPLIVPMGITYDQVIMEGRQLEYAHFGNSNISAVVIMMLFLLEMMICNRFFQKKEYIEHIESFLNVSCKLFFIFIIIEVVVVNLLGIVNWRELVMNFWGAFESDKIYNYSTVRFFGIKSAFGFYSEPSYVTGPLLVFYLINYFKCKPTGTNILWFLISFCVAVVSGSTNCIIAMCAGVLCLIKIVFVNKGVSVYKRIAICSLGVVIIIFSGFYVVQDSVISNLLFGKVLDKINAYTSLSYTTDKSSVSGYIRAYGNSVCYNILKTNPLFGVGLGTTRGYGLIPSICASYGIIGGACLLYYYRKIFNIQINRHNFIPFLVLLLFLTGIYSSGHTYSAILIPLFIVYNKTTILSGKRISERDYRNV